jgi:hypothetical protein
MPPSVRASDDSAVRVEVLDDIHQPRPGWISGIGSDCRRVMQRARRHCGTSALAPNMR